jgi:tetratricopeptide (TPR) repeat protein
MSIFDSFINKPKLRSSISKSTEARKNDADNAEQLYQSAYKGYAEVLRGDSLRAEALHEWGFALLNHAGIKSGDEADKLYEAAISRFSFCKLLNPDYLGAALNGGVAYMALARIRQAGCHDTLYETARQLFEEANRIQPGSASYNIACIHALRNEKDDCINTLNYCEQKGFLPAIDEIINDSDLANVKDEVLFIEFIAELNRKEEAAAEKLAAEKRAREEARLAKAGAVAGIAIQSNHQEESAPKPVLNTSEPETTVSTSSVDAPIPTVTVSENTPVADATPATSSVAEAPKD